MSKIKKPSLWKLFTSKRMGLSFLMGFSSGLPLITTGSTLQAWMTDAKIDLKVIGLFSLVGLPYTFKFLWSPFLDRYVLGKLGRRRGWMMVSQFGVMASLWMLSYLNPAVHLGWVACMAFVIAFMSASQDIVVDAYRRETLKDEELGLGASLYVNGYRIAMLVSGALALFLADQIPWAHVYRILALCMFVGIGTTLWADEPKGEQVRPPKTLAKAVVEPFLEYFKRPGALWMLAFILCYKLGDNMALQMTTPYFLQIGFTKTQIAAIAKTFGMGATIVGGVWGGVWLMSLGTMRALYVFGIFQMISTATFAIVHWTGPQIGVLALLMTLENLAIGMGTAAFLAFMASLTNRQFTATQYALFSSLMGVPRVIISAPTGFLAQAMGWPLYFVFCGLMAIPGLLLLSVITKKGKLNGRSIVS